MKRATKALARIWQWRFFVPLTPAGLCLLAAAVLLDRFYAAEEVDFVTHAAALAAMGLLAFSVLMVVFVTFLLWLRLSWRRPTKAQEIEARELQLQSNTRAATGFSFPPFVAWPLVQIRLQWANPSLVDVNYERTVGPEGSSYQEVVEPKERGRHPAIRRRFVVGDIFGLSRLGLLRKDTHGVRIAPCAAEVSGQVVTQFSAGDALSHPAGPVEGDPFDMRRYAHGDPLRRILWKAFARTRKLLVRAPERAIMPSPSSIAYFVAGPDDEASASAARFFVEQGLLGDDFLFGADGSREPTSDGAEAIEQIIVSVNHRKRGGQGLSHFLDQVQKRRHRSCVLFAPPRSGPWVDWVISAAKRVPGALVVLGVDGSLASAKSNFWRRMFFAGQFADLKTSRALPKLVNKLSQAGFDVHLLHRPSGQLVAAQRLLAVNP